MLYAMLAEKDAANKESKTKMLELLTILDQVMFNLSKLMTFA